MSENYEQLALNGLNKFRSKPSSLQFDISRFKLALERFGVKDRKFLADIDSTILELNTFPSLPKFVLRDDISKKATEEAQKFADDPKLYKRIKQGREIRNLCNTEDVRDDDCVLIAVEQDLPEDMGIKLLLNTDDKEKIGKKFLCGKDYIEVGIGHVTDQDEDIYAVVLIGKAGILTDESLRTDYDLTELKEAFDQFDNKGTGLIKISNVLEILEDLGFSDTNPEIFDIMKEMKDEKGEKISFPTFANFILANITNFSDDDYLKRIFNLYCDDKKNKTISALAFQDILKELGEKQSLEQIRKLLGFKEGSDIQLTFQEFKNYIHQLNSEPEEKEEVKEYIEYRKVNEIPANEPRPITKTSRKQVTGKKGRR